MSATIVNWPITLEQFLELPEAEPALEMGPCGEIKQKPLPNRKHALLQRELALSLEVYARPKQLGHSTTEERLILGGLARVPDVCFFRQSRLPVGPDGEPPDFTITPPDLAAEIYSPGQEGRRELVQKARWYIDQGVELVLLVDPERRTIRALSATRDSVFKDDEPLPLEGILPGLRLTPNDLFAALKP